MRSSEAATALTRPIQLAPTSSALRRGSEYAQLSRQIKEAGLLEQRPRYYIWKITLTAAALAAGWAAFVLVGDSWWQLAVAAFLAVVFTQIGCGLARRPRPRGRRVADETMWTSTTWHPWKEKDRHDPTGRSQAEPVHRCSDR